MGHKHEVHNNELGLLLGVSLSVATDYRPTDGTQQGRDYSSHSPSEKLSLVN